MTLLQTLRFLLQGTLFCETDLVIKICKFMAATAIDKSLRQCKIRFYLIVEQTLTFASSFNMVREVKTLLLLQRKFISELFIQLLLSCLMYFIFHVIMYFCFRTSQHRVITNNLRYQAVLVCVCFFLVSYSFDQNYCDESGFCKYCIYKKISNKSA